MPRTSGPPRRDRVDRLRNRELLVAAARRAFSEADDTNSPISLDAIARDAQVGIATLYRHFPTRESLAEAVYLSKLEELTDSFDESAFENAGQSLMAWMNRYVAFMLSKRGMMDTLRRGFVAGTAARSEAKDRIIDIVSHFLARGREDGSLRDDVLADDITMAMLGILAAASPDDDGAQASRLVHLLFTGFSVGR